MENFKLAVVGAGAMGAATVRGAVAAGWNPELIAVSNPSSSKLEALGALGVHTTHDNCEAVRCADLIVLAVKPWILPDVLAEIKPALRPGQSVAAIVASVSAADLLQMLGSEAEALADISIIMPNTAMDVRKSMTFIVEARSKADRARSLFCQMGEVMTIEERLLPAATALASCGIAYAMRYVRAATEGGVELGFRAADAQKIINATLSGACALLDREGAHPETEIDKVTTPGGLTIRGLNAMEQAGFTPAVIAGLKASSK